VSLRFEFTELYRKIEALHDAEPCNNDLFSLNESKSVVSTFDEFIEYMNGKISIKLDELFSVVIRVESSDGKIKEDTSIDKIHSGGTTISVKVLLHVILLREILETRSERSRGHNINPFKMPFFVDETGSLDGSNMDSIFDLAKELGMIPIIASPTMVVPNRTEVRYYFSSNVSVNVGSRVVSRIIIRKEQEMNLSGLHDDEM